jgi:hypothetical protein
VIPIDQDSEIFTVDNINIIGHMMTMSTIPTFVCINVAVAGGFASLSRWPVFTQEGVGLPSDAIPSQFSSIREFYIVDQSISRTFLASGAPGR